MKPAASIRTLCLLACLGLVGCGGTSSGYLPVDSPIMPFEPPDTDELVESNTEGWDDEPGDATEEDSDTTITPEANDPPAGKNSKTK